ncbi:hypothetical protein B0A58_00185 [Flavobacterium branchiophilum NBRC 15030 = ATCC 35035]|uniref:Uncharacterized protein n=1 Tax=Flavobacterium branchiophilum TaxID=55197 RepID=A0A543G6U3_9FLAO|nr:hypothetical protein [Flavobacterium branchiophilum]OXA82328.1 hypothetical protein B0A58_00185 [Flavobacterium branchiophilum NBRC 15030 = ATCC 35035]TQM41801.1 hypothetical protein BC670_2811 [Flavobacterium branchiophilum]GEM56369.1 hypothetical protein FB1_25900 [Flavobacterium branchiophilum NBRC 15030 = ATCC 35035]
MSNNKTLTNAIRFREPFAENYTLISETKVKSAYFDMQTTTRTRWVFRVLKVEENGDAEIELFTIEHLLVKTNNENLNDIISLNQVFSRMYSEIRVIIDVFGKITRIVNLQQIKDKWEDTKKQLLKIQQQEPALQALITINDEIFCSNEKIKLAIENNEFFKHYFGKIYGKTLPIDRKMIVQKNVLQTADAEWIYNFDYSPQFGAEHLNDIAVTSKALADTDKNEWKKQAYGHLPDVETKNLRPNLTEEAIYRSHFKTGRLHFAKTTITEMALPNFIEASMVYTIESDSYKENSSAIIENSQNKIFRVLD